jgi:putative ABC transport system permease protein
MMVIGRMNFYERIRELATLKVLGFRKNEMKRLALRENIWITIFGLPIGIIAALLLLDTALALAKTPDMEIAGYISAVSILAGCLLIFCFTLFVNYLISKKFKKIDMVESLKSVE